MLTWLIDMLASILCLKIGKLGQHHDRIALDNIDKKCKRTDLLFLSQLLCVPRYDIAFCQPLRPSRS